MLLTSSHQINFPDQSGLKLSRWISGTIGYELTCNDGGGLQYFFWQTKGVNEYVWEEPWLEVFNVTKSTTWDGHCVFKNWYLFFFITFGPCFQCHKTHRVAPIVSICSQSIRVVQIMSYWMVDGGWCCPNCRHFKCWSKNNLGRKEKSSIFKLWNGVNQK